jgi:hypothetical protein
MEWLEINDPKGVFIFSEDAWGGAVRGSYFPEDIQKLINDSTVQTMVHEVNKHFWETKGIKPIKLSHINGRPAVVGREEKGT